MASRPPDDGTADKLAALGRLLETAVQLTDELGSDPLAVRLTRAFARMPREDRVVLLAAIEREVEHRVVTSKTSSVTGYAMVANPNARLYLRVFGTRAAPLVGRDRDDMMLASLRSLKAMPLVLAPAVHAEWHTAAREASEQLTADERAAAARVLNEMLAILTTPNDEEAAPRRSVGE